jgi:hypothetical protein
LERFIEAARRQLRLADRSRHPSEEDYSQRDGWLHPLKQVSQDGGGTAQDGSSENLACKNPNDLLFSLRQNPISFNVYRVCTGQNRKTARRY